MSRARARWHAAGWTGLSLAAIVAVQLAAYGDLIGRFFSFDDFFLLGLADGIIVRSPMDVLRFFEPHATLPQYRPLTTNVYYWVMWALFGLDPTPWTVVGLGIQIVNAMLVFAIGRRLLGSPAGGLAAALIYASMPGHALALRWVAFVTVSGTATVYFLGLWTWLRANDRWRPLATSALFVVALLCSEHALSFPLAVTAIAVLAQGRRDWRRLARELAPLAVVGGLYLIAKLLFVYVLLPRRNPMAAAFFQASYALSLDRRVFETLGRYVTVTLGPLYAPDRTSVWYFVSGAATLALTVATVTASLALGSIRRSVGTVACGLALFVSGLGPVLLLPDHVFPAYIGAAGLGAALALVAPVVALPRGGAIALTVAAVLVGVHLSSGAVAIRTEGDFRTIEAFSEQAIRWLATIDRAAEPGTLEVVVPANPMTGRLFGVSHRIFLCAPYDVRTAQDIRAVAPRPGRVVLPEPALQGPVDGWRSVVRHCPR